MYIIWGGGGGGRVGDVEVGNVGVGIGEGKWVELWQCEWK